MSAEVHILGCSDLPAEQLLNVIAAQKPKNVVVLIQDPNGDWRTAWTNMEIASMTFAHAVLTTEMHDMIRGSVR